MISNDACTQIKLPVDVRMFGIQPTVVGSYLEIMPSAFGQFMRVGWEKLGLHQAEFCRRVGKPAGWVQQIREGKKTPPLGEMSTWANVLGLTGIDRQRFFDLAAIAHLPADAQPRFLQLAEEAARWGVEPSNKKEH